MRPEVKRSLRKALSIVLIVASLFLFAQGRWAIGGLLLIVAYFMLGDDTPPHRPPTAHR